MAVSSGPASSNALTHLPEGLGGSEGDDGSDDLVSGYTGKNGDKLVIDEVIRIADSTGGDLDEDLAGLGHDKGDVAYLKKKQGV